MDMKARSGVLVLTTIFACTSPLPRVSSLSQVSSLSLVSAVPSAPLVCVYHEYDDPLQRKLADLSYQGCLERAKLDPCDRIIDARESYLCHYPERPARPTSVRQDNILTIETQGHDFFLEDYLQPEKMSIVEFGYYWCSPCTAWKYDVDRNAASFPGIDFVVIGRAHV